jgi:hypothetical protein
LQSGKPAASGGFVEPLDVVDVEPVPVEPVLVPLIVPVLLPLLVLGVSLRTCLVTLSQHFTVPGAAALGEVVVVEVWATAIPMLPASIAAAISPIPVIRMRRALLVADESGALAVTYGNRSQRKPFLAYRVTKKSPARFPRRGPKVELSRRGKISAGLRWLVLVAVPLHRLTMLDNAEHHLGLMLSYLLRGGFFVGMTPSHAKALLLPPKRLDGALD